MSYFINDKSEGWDSITIEKYVEIMECDNDIELIHKLSGRTDLTMEEYAELKEEYSWIYTKYNAKNIDINRLDGWKIELNVNKLKTDQFITLSNLMEKPIDNAIEILAVLLNPEEDLLEKIEKLRGKVSITLLLDVLFYYESVLIAYTKSILVYSHQKLMRTKKK